MKGKIFFVWLLISASLFPFTDIKAQRAELLRQQIEILQFEVSLLRSLLLNMQKQETVSAESYIAVNLSDNSVLLQKNSNIAYPIASVTKLMTALLTKERINSEQKIILTKEMLLPLGSSPSIYFGLNISAGNLLKASLIQSVNDAAEALSYYVGKEKFVDFMNEKAKDLAMINTIFYDSHGLNTNNRASASDIAKLLAHIYKNQPEILDITKDNNFWLPDKTGWLLKFQNVNNFYPLSGFIGGKTGFLPEAKQTLASVFDVNGNPVAIVILHSVNRQADALKIIKDLEASKLSSVPNSN